MLVVLDCEDDIDLCNMFTEDRAQFDRLIQDVDWLQDRRFYIIDGAHRHHLATQFGEQKVWRAFDRDPMLLRLHLYTCRYS
jgi:hypothetical protein